MKKIISKLNTFTIQIMALREILYYVIFYTILRRLAIKRVPKFDLWVRRIEFVILAQLTAPIGMKIGFLNPIRQ